MTLRYIQPGTQMLNKVFRRMLYKTLITCWAASIFRAARKQIQGLFILLGFMVEHAALLIPFFVVCLRRIITTQHLYVPLCLFRVLFSSAQFFINKG